MLAFVLIPPPCSRADGTVMLPCDVTRTDINAAPDAYLIQTEDGKVCGKCHKPAWDHNRGDGELHVLHDAVSVIAHTFCLCPHPC